MSEIKSWDQLEKEVRELGEKEGKFPKTIKLTNTEFLNCIKTCPWAPVATFASIPGKSFEIIFKE